MKDTNKITFDLLKVLVLLIIIIGIMIIFKFDYTSLKLISLSDTLLSIFVALLGFIITALTIIFMFDADKNLNLKKIQEADLYPQIIERFTSTTIILFVGVVIFLVLLIFDLSPTTGFFLIFFDVIIFYLLLLTLLRLYRCVNILRLVCKLASKKD